MIIHFHNSVAGSLFELIEKQIDFIGKLINKIIVFFIPLPLFLLGTGISGIINDESPESLASINTMGMGFIDHINMHTLIFLGAFGITFIIWFITRKIWVNSERKIRKHSF